MSIAGVRQASFAGGEISPSLYGRTDIAKYDVSLRKCRNWIITPQGALINRPGTRFVDYTKTTGKKVRLIPFVFSRDQSYVCEFGENYIRFYQNGAQVKITGITPLEVYTPYVEADLPKLKYAQVGDIITITHQNYPPYELRRYSHLNWRMIPIVPKSMEFWPVWSATATYAEGDRVSVVDSGTLIRYYTALQATTNNFPTGAPTYWSEATTGVPPTGIGFLGDGGTTQDVDQEGDVSHPPKQWQWVVTSIFSDGTESLPSRVLEANASTAYTAPTPAAAKQPKNLACILYTDRPQNITWLAVPEAVAYRVYRGRNGVFGLVAEVDPASVSTKYGGCMFKDDAMPPDYGVAPPIGAWPFGTRPWKPNTYYRCGDRVVSGSNVYECTQAGTSGPTSGPSGTGTDIADPAGVNAWVTGAYTAGTRVYSQGNSYRCVSNHTATGATGPWGQDIWATYVQDSLSDPATPSTSVWEFVGQGGPAHWKYLSAATTVPTNYPAVVNYYEQRRLFANTADHPSGIWMSRTGQYWNFDTGLFTTPDSAMQFDLASKVFEEIRSVATIRVMGAITSQGQWAVSGGGGPGTPLTPASIYAKSQLVYPAGWIDPLVVGNIVLYVQDKSNVVRDLTYQFMGDSYTSADLTMFSSHLFWTYQITSWCYQQIPFGVVWAVRDDGKLLGMTYQKDQEVLAWHWHDTGLEGDKFEEVACIPEGGLDVVYAVVKRGTARFIEKLMPRLLQRYSTGLYNTIDGVFLDSSLSYSGSPATVFSGLTHLEGREVSVLADGNVYGPYTVASGAVNIAAECPDGASTVHIGMEIVSDVEFLPPKIPGQDIKRSNLKLLPRISFEVADSRGGLFVGPGYDKMREWRQREVQDSYGIVVPFTGLDHLRFPGGYTHDVPLCIRQMDPLPVTLLAVDREVDVGGD